MSWILSRSITDDAFPTGERFSLELVPDLRGVPFTIEQGEALRAAMGYEFEE